MNDAISQTVRTDALDEDRRRRIYILSVGSGGFKASHESVDVCYRPDEENQFVVRFSTPVSVDEKFRTNSLEAAVQRAQTEAKNHLLNPVLARAPAEIPDIPPELSARF